jgi:hypothetical protein
LERGEKDFPLEVKMTIMRPTDWNRIIPDIRQAVHIPSPWLWAVWIVGALAILVLLISLIRRWRRSVAPPSRLPHEIALERLIQVQALMVPERARDFSLAVSDIIRGYIEERFQVRTTHHTTGEFLHDLVVGPDSQLAEYRTLLAQFLRHCDLAKFAHWRLALPEMESMHQSARTFVLQTSPAMEDNAEKWVQRSTISKSPRAHLDTPVPSVGSVRPHSRAGMR